MSVIPDNNDGEVRAGNPVAPRWEFQRNTNQEGHIKKNYAYYRRKGAFWTDFYHTPRQNLHLVNYRPDLDRKHEEYVKKRQDEEELSKNKGKYRKVCFRQYQRLKMWKRRKENFNKAINGTQKHLVSQDCPAPGFILKRENKTKEHVTKDRAYYRRKGFIWTDLVHVPPDRMNVVVRPETIQADERAVKSVKTAMEKEQKEERRKKKKRNENIRGIRKTFVAREARRVAFEKKVMQNVDKDVRRVCGVKNVDKEALQSRKVSEAFTRLTTSLPNQRNAQFEGPDFAGLLTLDPAISDKLRKVYGHDCLPMQMGKGDGVLISSSTRDSIASNSKKTAKKKGIEQERQTNEELKRDWLEMEAFDHRMEQEQLAFQDLSIRGL